MPGVMIVAIVFGGIVLALTIIGSTILMGLRILKGGISKKDKASESNESKIVQEIYQGMTRMENRVEALETIILDRERKDHTS